MSQQPYTLLDEEFVLRDYLLVLLRKWWIVVGVLAVTVVAGWLYWRLQTDEYEARTRVLVASPMVENLSALATPNELLQQIIVDLDLRNSTTERISGVEQLTAMMNPELETSGLLTMTVRGEDPEELKRIANKWAELFVEKDNQSLTAQAGQSYDSTVSLFEESENALRDKQEEKRVYLQENSLASLQRQLEVTSELHKESLLQLLAKRADAEAQPASNDEVLKELDLNLAENANALDALRIELIVITAQNTMNQIVGRIGVMELRDLENLTAQLDNEARSLSEDVAKIQIDLSLVDYEIEFLTNDRNRLAQSIVEAQGAKANQADSTRVVESAVEPQVPVGPNQRRYLLLPAALGLFLGVVLAFFVHYLQGPQAPRQEGNPTQLGATDS